MVRNRMRSRGQEEMVGFVLIIIVVAVVFLVFLGITIRQDGSTGERDSREVYEFLDSLMEYTSECAINFEPDYSNVRELLVDCQENRRCTSGFAACDILKEILDTSLNESFGSGGLGANGRFEGYDFVSNYRSEIGGEKIISVSRGSCENSTEIRGSEYISPAFPGTIASSLKVCF